MQAGVKKRDFSTDNIVSTIKRVLRVRHFIRTRAENTAQECTFVDPHSSPCCHNTHSKEEDGKNYILQLQKKSK